jgi:hypothetical protein
MDLSFQGQKTDHFYLAWIKFYSERNTKKLLKIKKSLHTVKRTVKKHVFANISGTGYDILTILTDSDSAGQGLYSEKKYIKINAKTRIKFQDIKILKNMHILACNQNFEKLKKWNSKIPKPMLLLSC